jgi:hypothetical protein
MSIKQLNATYVPEEDRVLFRLTTQPSDEYRVWLTRARVAELIHQGEQAAIVKLQTEHAPPQAKAIAEFKQQVVQQTTTFTQFEPATRLPLGAEPTLVKALRFEIKDQQQILHLDLIGNRTLSLKLNDDLLSKMRLLLQTVATKANWQIESPAHNKNLGSVKSGVVSQLENKAKVRVSSMRSDTEEASADQVASGNPKKLLH